jgi:hypothetical protein
MTTELDTMLAYAGNFAKQRLVKDGETSITPMYDFVDAEGKHSVTVMPWRNEERRRYMAAAGLLAIKFNAVCACFMSEGWMVQVDTPLTSWHKDRAMQITPSQHPDRIEIVQVIATDGETTKARIWQIVRTRPGDERAPVIALMEKKRDGDDDGKYEGPGLEPLVNALKLMRIARDNPALQPRLAAMQKKVTEMLRADGFNIDLIDGDDK